MPIDSSVSVSCGHLAEAQYKSSSVRFDQVQIRGSNPHATTGCLLPVLRLIYLLTLWVAVIPGHVADVVELVQVCRDTDTLEQQHREIAGLESS